LLRNPALVGNLTSLQALNSIAPNLQEVYCDHLALCSIDHGSLPRVTVLGAHSAARLTADEVSVVFPQLTATYQIPQARHTGPNGISCCPLWPAADAAQLRCMRRLGGDAQWVRQLHKQQKAGRPQHIECLAWHNMKPREVDNYIGRLATLHSLSLTFEPATKPTKKLLQEVRGLTKLKRLALPAKLLCSRCCPAGHSFLQELLHPPAAAADSAAEPAGSSTSQQLEQLLLLSGRPGINSSFLGTCCKHLDGLDWEHLTSSLVAAAAAGRQPAEPEAGAPELVQPVGMPQQLQVLRVRLPDGLQHLGSRPGRMSQAGPAPDDWPWGVFGPVWYV